MPYVGRLPPRIPRRGDRGPVGRLSLLWAGWLVPQPGTGASIATSIRHPEPTRHARLRRVVVARAPSPSSAPTALVAMPVREIVVAIPARDEESVIAACLASVDGAAERCPVPVRVVVAADRCRDRTAELAAEHPAVHCDVAVVAGRWRTVGEARAAAVAAARPDAASWIANTDADCRVPVDWLHRHLACARRGLHAVAGVVRLDATETPAGLVERFGAHYESPGRRGRHVHAANFGVHADAYGRAGGWSRRCQLGEEHRLWDQLRRHRCQLAHDDGLWVFTSARADGRAPGGFAHRLRRWGEVPTGS